MLSTVEDLGGRASRGYGVPCPRGTFALYLQHVGEASRSKSAVEEAVNAVSWVQQISGLQPISQSPFVCATLSGLQRKLAKPRVRKEPVTTDILSALVDSFSQFPTLTNIRLGAIALLSFLAFLQYDEVAKLRCCDIKFTPEAMSVVIRSSKTDQYRQGDVVPVARTGTAMFPVGMMERYYEMGEIGHNSDLPLFRAITTTKCGQRLRASGSLSYTRMREIFLGKLSELGLDASKFGLHSLRAGLMEPQWQLMRGWLTVYSSVMADGGQKLLKMAMLRIHARRACLSLRA